MKLNQLTLTQALAGIKAQKFSAREVYDACVAAIKEKNPDLHAFLDHTDGSNYQDRGRFHGLPLAIKDNFCTHEFQTRASSAVLDGFHAPYQATVVNKLAEAGFSFLGKTNMDAWAHGSSTETSDYGPTKNPRNPAHAPGGSSGGSAAAVAADMCLAALGSETAGSVRQPAAWCGCVGFRPSYGRASRYGVIAMASSTDSPGFLAKTTADAALLTPLICGPDPYDATSSPEKFPDLSPHLATSLKGKKIGFLYLDIPGLESTRAYYEQAWRDLEKLGAQVSAATARDPQEAIGVYTVVQRSEVASNLGRYDGLRYGHTRDHFGAEARRRIMLGTFLLSQGYADKYYVQAQKVRTLFMQDFARLFSEFDILVSPVSPSFAKTLGSSEGNALFGELEDIFVEPSAICGLPAGSVPCYHDPATNLYLGLNIMAPFHHETDVIEVMSAFETGTHWNSWHNQEK
ncbi:Asp-tRNA(Asn)/Glu-tRNA(Gln) amidotransferase subunit GatA [bacterium]|nr:Asp-tRNA(Asn)/Glu-tRNA(Gln) amidotransferase subunit GatA [bacterium]